MNPILLTACRIAVSMWSLAAAGAPAPIGPWTASEPCAASTQLAATAGKTVCLSKAAPRPFSSQRSACALALPSPLPASLASGNADDCSTARAITGAGPFAFDNTAATTGPQQGLGCGTGTCNNDVWFQWTASASGTCIFSLCGGGATYDTLIAVYPGAGCPGGAALACNDDSCGVLSQLGFPVTAGSVYMLQIGAWSATGFGAGTFTMTIAPPATNDDCSTPTIIAGTGVFSFDNTSATTGVEGQAEQLCNVAGSTSIDADVWFAWTAPFTGTFSASTCGGTSIDTKMAVYLGSGCPTSGALACNDDACSVQSQILFVATGGTTYTFQIGSSPGAGHGLGNWTLTPVGVGAANDDPCSTPISLPETTNGTPVGGSGYTTTTGLTPGNCYGGLFDDSWYTWTPQSTDVYTFSFCSPPQSLSFSPGINIYDNSPCPGANVGCGNRCGGGEVCFPATAGQTYWVQFGSQTSSPAWSGSPQISIQRNRCVTATTRCEPGQAGVAPCPCGNPPSGSARGCNNSAATGGASLTASGNPSIGADTVVFTTSSQKPTGTSVLLQGTTLIPAGVVFGQGVRCVGGVLKRLYLKSAVGGSISAPVGADPTVTARSAALGDPILAGTSRFYLVYYRDPIVLGGCPATATFNATNGLEVLWTP